jgi:hypothetical protein
MQSVAIMPTGSKLCRAIHIVLDIFRASGLKERRRAACAKVSP